MKQHNLLAIWDSIRQPLFIGGILTFFQELSLLKNRYLYHSIDMCLIDASAKAQTVSSLSNSDRSKSALLKLFSAYRIIDDMVVASSADKVEEWGRMRGYDFWPQTAQTAYEMYGNTLFIQSEYKRLGKLQWLEMYSGIRKNAQFYIKRHCGRKVPIAVHMKRTAGCTNCSNANIHEWSTFFESIQKDHPEILFLLVSPDPVSKEIASLNNVHLTQTDKVTLTEDLAIIRQSAAFIGMASGPANMAIFSPVAYSIFKDKSQHQDEMIQELGNGDAYPFATPYQHLYRVDHTAEHLIAAFNQMYPGITQYISHESI